MQLVISHKGAKLSVKDGNYRIRWQEEEQLLPPSKVSSLLLHPTTALTHEAVRLAIAHQAELLFVDETGFPFARLWSPRFGSISTIRKNQVYFAQGAAAVDWIKAELVLSEPISLPFKLALFPRSCVRKPSPSPLGSAFLPCPTKKWLRLIWSIT